MEKKDITIDAAGKSLGRIASQAAKTLMGKTHPDYAPNVESAPRVTIVNATKLSISEKKALGKTYT
ncbi:uL13 family ribosomal protein, partial [Bradyrhizobium sp. NBAIM08]|uniref:uL13 family ribosomal protein n=1 Tax=Bradyrhizobium sp. NBAIM08 TaxID=2793815 RepID=UPI001CD4F53C